MADGKSSDNIKRNLVSHAQDDHQKCIVHIFRTFYR